MVWKREWAAISADAETAQFQARASAGQDLCTALGWVAGKWIVGCGYFLQSCSMDETRRQTKSGRFAVAAPQDPGSSASCQESHRALRVSRARHAATIVCGSAEFFHLTGF
jgi:hypothetical protein